MVNPGAPLFGQGETPSPPRRSACTPVGLRETIHNAKVWVKDADGQAVPGWMDLPEGWDCLPNDREE